MTTIFIQGGTPMNHFSIPSIFPQENYRDCRPSSMASKPVSQKKLVQFANYGMSKKTKRVVAAILGGLVFAGQVSAIDVSVMSQDRAKEQGSSTTNTLTGSIMTQSIPFQLGKTVQAAENPATSAIPAEVSAETWNNPDINTKQGFTIVLSKLTKKPAFIYPKVLRTIEELNENEVSMLRIAFLISEDSTCPKVERAGAIWKCGQALLEDRNAQVVVDEYNATKDLRIETIEKYKYDNSVVMTAVNTSTKLGERALRVSGLKEIVSKERCEARLQQITEIYMTVSKQNKEAIIELRKMGEALDRMNGIKN